MSPADPLIAARHAALVHRLGGEACVVPVPSSLPVPALEVGRLGPLPCWSLATSLREARTAARLIARRGRLGLVLADDDAIATRLLAVTIAPVHCAVVSLQDPAPLAIRRLGAWRPGDAPPLEAAVHAAAALDIDAAGRRAFALLHAVLGRIAAALPGRIPASDRHAWGLLQATRLLFLRFVEAEGWLDGQPDFLRRQVDRVFATRRDPGRYLLQPLFFGTLNRRAATRSRLARSFGTIPFLNGGLFEPHPIERQRHWALPRDEWAHLFGLVVDQVEVTLDSDVTDGRVTPELLGRVFEGVMDPAERRNAGAFYTPPALVRAMVREALACHLAPHLAWPEHAVADALDDPDPDLRRRLLDLRVLDPAVGSGAFLVGALDLLHGPGPRDPRRVGLLVTRRLHGIDRHPGAVRLTELRLWLEALRAMRGRGAGAVAPLPNLDASIRAGDALLDPLGGHPLAPRAALALAAERRAVVQSHGAAKRAALRALRDAEHRAIADALAHREESLAHAIRDLAADATERTLFGVPTRSSPTARRKLQALREAWRAVRAERRALARDTASAPFALEAAFAPVLQGRGGFDLVIGNPPWVRAERIAPAVRTAIAARFRWWRGSGSGWRHQPDLAVAFLERSAEALAPGGTLALLVPGKLLTAGYARVARDALARGHTIHRVADLTHDPRAGFEATTYPLAIITSRRLAPEGHGVACALDGHGSVRRQAEWRDHPCWSLGDPSVLRIAHRLAAAHPALGASHPPRLGVKTGANEAFLDPPETLHRWTRPAVRGRDLTGNRPLGAHRLLWPADNRGEPWPALPRPVAQHLGQYRARLESRADRCDARWWRLFRTDAATAPHRVVWPDLARTLRVRHDLPREAVPLNSCYVIAVAAADEAVVLAGWLSTTWIRALAMAGAEAAAGGHRRFGARTVGAVPLPLAVLGGAFSTHEDPTRQDDLAAELLELATGERDALRALATARR